MGEQSPRSRHRVPVLRSRSLVRWLVATAVALVVGGGYYAVTDPTTRPYVALVLGVLLVVTVAHLTARTEVDPATGEVERRALGGAWRRSAQVVTGPGLSLSDSGTGILTLDVHGPRLGPLRLPLVRIDDYVEASLDAPTLRLLAYLVGQRDDASESRLTTLLREQADHVDSGAEASRSPLAAAVSHGVLSAAKVGGGLATGGLLGRFRGS